MAEYETQVAFYQRYNYGATAEMRKELIDQMNRILDDLYENRYEELYDQMDIDGDGIDEPFFPMTTAYQQTNRAIFMKMQYLFRY